jgi:hypothetical protein
MIDQQKRDALDQAAELLGEQSTVARQVSSQLWDLP